MAAMTLRAALRNTVHRLYNVEERHATPDNEIQRQRDAAQHGTTATTQRP